ncbi:MAG: hypothetical protein IT168_08310 [Bryobacterales bacterium]|nr:hypothetical protein [Bryobacterales bacterium]
MLAITTGPEGPLSVPAIPVAPVDNTGAGDSFNSGFLSFACACEALSTLGPGGNWRPGYHRASPRLPQSQARPR